LHGSYGLALDNVMSLDVVTADGRLLTANASENEDLFWGLRGSGGNLGIVISLEYCLYELGPVLGGATFYPVERTKELLHFFRDWAPTIPDELVIQGFALTLTDVGPVLGIEACYNGEIAEGERLLKPLRSQGRIRNQTFSGI